MENINKIQENITPIKNQTINHFLDGLKSELNIQYNKNEKLKFSSSDDFSSVVENLSEKYEQKKNPVIIGNVGGFYAIASLVGKISAERNSDNKPMLLFFDKKGNSIQNAMFNTLLLKMAKSKEEYLTMLFGLDKNDIVKAFNSKLYDKFIKNTVMEIIDLSDLTNDELTNKIKLEYKINKQKIDKLILKNYINGSLIDEILKNKFSLNKLESYNEGLEYYDILKHQDILSEKGKKKIRW